MEWFIFNEVGSRYTNTIVEESGKNFHDIKMPFVSQAFQLLSVGNLLLFWSETETINRLTEISEACLAKQTGSWHEQQNLI